MIAFWAFLGSIVFIYILWRKAIDREQKLKEENLIFRYETIKGQVNPHFLFNSLNTLSSLVRTNPDVAEEYINKLASIYRYILDNVQSNHVPLQVEIAFVNDYFSLHKIRDGEKIQLNIQLNDINKYKVLPISLQILIENAIKHNMATRESPLYISLQYEDGYIVVKNNLQKMVNLGRSSGNGLKNLQERIVLLSIIETVEGSVNYLQNNPLPDLILMDVQLDDGVCFEIFETIKVNTPVIFTTAYNEYALQAFKVNSVDYLLKPIEEGLLQQAIDKFKTIHFKDNQNINAVTQLLTEYRKQFKTRFLVKIGSHYKSILLNDISNFYIFERATFIYSFSGHNYAIDDSLDNLQKMLDPDKFFRINRNYLINIDAITDIVSYSSSRLVVKLNNNPTNEDLIISREKVSEFKQWIDK